MRWRGRRVEIALTLPPMPADSEGPAFYPVKRVELNGQELQGAIGLQQLSDGNNRIEVSFDRPVTGDTRITRVATVNPKDRSDPRVFAPDVPRGLSAVPGAGGVVLRFTPPPYREDLRFNIYRDGQQLAADLKATNWTDRVARPGVAHVYAVEAVGVSSGHRSHLSEPIRLDVGAVQRVKMGDWFVRPASGRVGLELLYDNHAHETQTGVTNAVKVLRVLDNQGHEAGRGIVQMPHIEPVKGQHPKRLSTMLRIKLPAGRYRVELVDFFNMSYLKSNAKYGGPGGAGGPINAADIDALQVVTLPDGP
jgi:hypothetical protein